MSTSGRLPGPTYVFDKYGDQYVAVPGSPNQASVSPSTDFATLFSRVMANLVDGDIIDGKGLVFVVTTKLNVTKNITVRNFKFVVQGASGPTFILEWNTTGLSYQDRILNVSFIVEQAVGTSGLLITNHNVIIIESCFFNGTSTGGAKGIDKTNTPFCDVVNCVLLNWDTGIRSLGKIRVLNCKTNVAVTGVVLSTVNASDSQIIGGEHIGTTWAIQIATAENCLVMGVRHQASVAFLPSKRSRFIGNHAVDSTSGLFLDNSANVGVVVIGNVFMRNIDNSVLAPKDSVFIGNVLIGTGGLFSTGLLPDVSNIIAFNGEGAEAREFHQNVKVSASTPTTSDIQQNSSRVWKNTTDGTVKLYYNDAGILKSVTLA